MLVMLSLIWFLRHLSFLSTRYNLLLSFISLLKNLNGQVGSNCCLITFTYFRTSVQTFNGKKWEKFNSEKVASLAYARIQGKIALVSHFQNSSLMNEDKRCRPILFHSEGQQTGDQVEFSSFFSLECFV